MGIRSPLAEGQGHRLCKPWGPWAAGGVLVPVGGGGSLFLRSEGLSVKATRGAPETPGALPLQLLWLFRLFLLSAFVVRIVEAILAWNGLRRPRQEWL